MNKNALKVLLVFFLNKLLLLFLKMFCGKTRCYSFPDNEAHRLRSPDFICLRGALQNLTTGLRPKVGVNSHIF